MLSTIIHCSKLQNTSVTNLLVTTITIYKSLPKFTTEYPQAQNNTVTQIKVIGVKHHVSHLVISCKIVISAYSNSYW